ncbi:neuronal acetylcholine receptor subunit alpha-6-like isoform X1 [Vespa mandarinia]|uniref:neuronal acetylcholine receptor subunit alpha-6-like isoform X1 n=1 Tax=Vespa mandarinia TaxID=7446 RepID=UPI00160D0C54|nr:neuronal acetylcholine receptor subunit alpha-6-like isoform X1 [Vespa mandarinia]
MILFVLLLIGYVTLSDTSFIFNNYEVQENLGCNEIESKSTVLQLKRHLFCEYIKSIRPVSNHRTTTNIEFGIIPKFINVEDDENVMELHCWTILMWEDGHLTWEPSQYNDVNFLHVKSNELWISDVMMHNSGSHENEIPFTNCWLSNTGKVKCVATTKYIVKCLRDYTWWPYDFQNCTIQIGSWSYSDEELQFVLINTGIIMNEFQKNLEWEIVRSYVITHTESYKFGFDLTSAMISFHFILRRHFNAIHATYLSSIIILIIMTLTTLWLNPKSTERMILANLNFICHLLFLEEFYWQIHGGDSTMLMKFFMKSLALACFTLIITSILRHLLELTTETPTWIATRISTIVKSKIGRILLVSILDPKASAELETEAEDNANLVISKKNEVTWKHVVMLISWINFLCILFIYIILISIYFPTQSSGYSYNFNT